MPATAIAKHSYNSLILTFPSQHFNSPNGCDTIDSTRTTNKESILLYQKPGHDFSFLIPHSNGVINQRTPDLKIRRHPIDSDSFYDSIHLVPPSRAFALRDFVEHYTVLHLVQQS